MFSVIEFEKKNIKTAADLWISRVNDDFYALWPAHKENRPVELNNCVKNREKPKLNWVKKRCTILQSQFDSYAKAKSAENRIRKLERPEQTKLENLIRAEEKSGSGQGHGASVAKPAKLDQTYTTFTRSVYESAVVRSDLDMFVQTEPLEETASVELADGNGAFVAEPPKLDQTYTAFTRSVYDSVVIRSDRSDMCVQTELLEETASVELYESHGAFVVEPAMVDQIDTIFASEITLCVFECNVIRSDKFDVGTQTDPLKETASVELAEGHGAFVEYAVHGVGADSELRYKLPLKKTKHIKRYQKALKSEAFLSAQATELSDCYDTEDYKEMVRVVSAKVLDDYFLQNYSYCGQRKKKPLRKYSNVIEVIIKATMLRYMYVPREDILEYFKDHYVKYAKRRYDRS